MIGKNMQTAINDQIQAEFYSAYLYLAMSQYCASKTLNGFANWLKVQYEEETAHALKLVDFLQERGGEVALKTIDAPPAGFGSPVQVFEQVVKHEAHVTALIHKLYETAMAEKDYAAQVFLQWYVNEQVEEEASANEILSKLQMIGDKSGGILYLDKELGKRGK